MTRPSQSASSVAMPFALTNGLRYARTNRFVCKRNVFVAAAAKLNATSGSNADELRRLVDTMRGNPTETFTDGVLSRPSRGHNADGRGYRLPHATRHALSARE